MVLLEVLVVIRQLSEVLHHLRFLLQVLFLLAAGEAVVLEPHLLKTELMEAVAVEAPH